LIGVLGVQGDVSEHMTAVERVGGMARKIKHPDDLADVVGLILPGGESTTHRRLLEYEDLLSAIGDRYRDGMAAFGTCAGAILLATEVHGAPTPHLSLVDITVRRNAFGRQRESFVTDLDVVGLEGGPLRAVFIRAPIIERLGPGIDVLATIDGEIVLAESDRALVAAFHPELTADDRLHKRFLEKTAAAKLAS
jgi:5'-phosphate synthase pdxT subunit